MLESFEINSSTGAYSVSLVDGSKESLLVGDTVGQQVILVDDRLRSSYSFPDIGTIAIPATEEAKSLEHVAPIIEKLRALKASRESHLVAIGGGTIQDVATFVASIYMRGIKWSYFPTTLLGMVDSCIGGKSSINVGNHKNLVGNFYPPEKVVIDVRYLTTLNKSQVVSGLMEAAKISYAKGAESFATYLAETKSIEDGTGAMLGIISHSLRTKKWFIEVDEFDRNERLLLNFGHTFGHALESASGFQIPHGIAVGIGMLVAVEYSKLGGLVAANYSQLLTSLMDHASEQLSGVPEALRAAKRVSPDMLLKNFESDKKHSRDQYRVIVPVESGFLRRISIDKTPATKDLLVKAYERAFSKFPT